MMKNVPLNYCTAFLGLALAATGAAVLWDTGTALLVVGLGLMLFSTLRR